MEYIVNNLILSGTEENSSENNHLKFRLTIKIC